MHGEARAARHEPAGRSDHSGPPRGAGCLRPAVVTGVSICITLFHNLPTACKLWLAMAWQGWMGGGTAFRTW